MKPLTSSERIALCASCARARSVDHLPYYSRSPTHARPCEACSDCGAISWLERARVYQTKVDFCAGGRVVGPDFLDAMQVEYEAILANLRSAQPFEAFDVTVEVDHA